MHNLTLDTCCAVQTVPRAVLAALVRALQEQSASPEEEALQQEAALLVPQLLAVLLTARPELQPLAADTNAVTDLCQQYIAQSSVQAHQKARTHSCNRSRPMHSCSLPPQLPDLSDRSCWRNWQHAEKQRLILVSHSSGRYRLAAPALATAPGVCVASAGGGHGPAGAGAPEVHGGRHDAAHHQRSGYAVCCCPAPNML